MPNSPAICFSGRPLERNSAAACCLNSGVNSRRALFIGHLSSLLWSLLRGVHQFERRSPRVDDRWVISGILHVLKTGCRWRDVPAAHCPRPPSTTASTDGPEAVSGSGGSPG
ncbi:transposase [Teichococcus wenyumeiae]|uniref:transposase n=1 Tax=Teichococcus wenyumeiae TaxID=2478470 RepID=UPI003461FCC5